MQILQFACTAAEDGEYSVEASHHRGDARAQKIGRGLIFSRLGYISTKRGVESEAHICSDCEIANDELSEIG